MDTEDNVKKISRGKFFLKSEKSISVASDGCISVLWQKANQEP